MALRGTLTHRKTRRLAQALSMDPPCAMGILEALWHTTAEQAPNGAIGRMSDSDIAMEIFYSGDPVELVRALVEAGFLDEHPQYRLIVHDWYQHSDDATNARLARTGQRYATGEIPRLTKFSQKERDVVLARFAGVAVDGAQKEETAQIGADRGTAAPIPEERRTTGHKGALPEPVPVPEPEEQKQQRLSPSAPPGDAGPGGDPLNSNEPVPGPPLPLLLRAAEHPPPNPAKAAVTRVFAYFLQKTGRRATQYELTEPRMKVGLRAYGVCQKRFPGTNACGDDRAELAMAEAVLGMASNKHLMGENDRNRRYCHWIENCFKNVEEMEKRWEDAGGCNV